MNGQEMYLSVNKGVPNYVTVPININTILNECASDKSVLYGEMKALRNKFQDDIISIMGYSKAQYYFFDDLCTRTKFKNAENEVYISPYPFFIKLKRILGIDNPSLDFNDLMLRNEMRVKVEELKTVRTPDELKEKFPLIYEDYELSIKGYAKICSLEEERDRTGDPAIREKCRNTWKKFKGYGLHSRFDRFMEKQCVMYRNFVERRQFIEGLCFKNPLDFEGFKGLDKDKFEMYLADKYLDIAVNSTTLNEKQNAIYYVTAYFRQTKVSNISIKNDKGEVVTFKKLVNKYRKLLKDNVGLKPVDEPREKFKGYNVNHVVNHINKYFGAQVSWTIVPNGDDDVDNKDEVIEVLNRRYSHLPEEERQKIIFKKYELYERKINFFENTNYVFKVYGVSEFDGYVAYVYANGEILLERFFSDYTECMPASGEAIYNLNIYNFEEKSKFSKAVLMKDPEVRRIIHCPTFESQARAIIEKEAPEGTTSDVEAFTLKFKGQKK